MLCNFNMKFSRIQSEMYLGEKRKLQYKKSQKRGKKNFPVVIFVVVVVVVVAAAASTAGFVVCQWLWYHGSGTPKRNTKRRKRFWLPISHRTGIGKLYQTSVCTAHLEQQLTRILRVGNKPVLPLYNFIPCLKCRLSVMLKFIYCARHW